ncbi:MAG: energy transducer TonB [Gemmatimonadota bacterium]
MRDGAPLGRVAALLAALASGGCADTVRPVLGGLKIGAGAGPFHMPVLQNEAPPFEYPRDAWERGVGGETTLKIHIATTGWVDTVRIARSSGDASLDSAAVAGARLLRYRPARQGDEPVAVWAYLPIRYPLPERVQADDDGEER